MLRTNNNTVRLEKELTTECVNTMHISEVRVEVGLECVQSDLSSPGSNLASDSGPSLHIQCDSELCPGPHSGSDIQKHIESVRCYNPNIANIAKRMPTSEFPCKVKHQKSESCYLIFVDLQK